MRVLDFQHVALFRNQSASKATWVWNRGQIRIYSPLVNTACGMGEMSEWIEQVQLWTQPLIHFRCGAVAQTGKLNVWWESCKTDLPTVVWRPKIFTQYWRHLSDATDAGALVNVSGHSEYISGTRNPHIVWSQFTRVTDHRTIPTHS